MIASQRPRRMMVAGPRGAPVPSKSAGAIIAYDYGATFKLTGRPGNVVEDVINVSPDGTFVAVAVGYGFEEERATPLGLLFVGRPPATVKPGELQLRQLPTDSLITGFRVNPLFDSLVFKGLGRAREFSNTLVPSDLVRLEDPPGIFQRLRPSDEISFLFSIVDSSTGRELQDEPTHNLASLGKRNGERPFRLLAHPITFAPRSTVRLQVIERTEGVTGTLFIVLYGYMILGSSVCPETVARRLIGPWKCPVETVGRPSDRVIPFDYVVTIPLSGRPQNLVENETVVSAEGGFVATSLGYGLLGEEGAVITKVIPTTASAGNVVNLNLIHLESFAIDALVDGVRINPNFLRIAFKDNGELADKFPLSSVNQLFERLNFSEDVSFRYMIFDSGRGRELQNIPLHNVAGLGIANGERPFKRLARPMVWLPRSTIRIQVQEHFGRGTLFFVFQGYKLLGPAMREGGR